MDQKSFDFIEDDPTPHQVNLDHERRQSLIDLMSNIVIHVFQFQESKTDEPSQE